MAKRPFFQVDEPPFDNERFEVFFQNAHVTIERIVSSGNQPPTQHLQDHDEWILLVRGEAEMTVNGERVSLKAGDTLLLPASVPHEVLSTSANALWLAVHAR
jgi:cupin 2 domain-containing protein